MTRLAFPFVLLLVGCLIAVHTWAEPRGPVWKTAGPQMSSALTPAEGLAALERKVEIEAGYHAALAARTNFQYLETPLTDVVESLQRKLKIEIHLDRKALEDEGVDTATPVTINLEGRSVRAGLRLILNPLGLTFLITDEVLMITTKVKAEENLEMRVYEVSDLVLVDLDDPQAGADYDSLIDAITSTVSPQSWDEVGGRGSMTPFRAAGIEALVTSQTDQVNEGIVELLAKLRLARRGTRRKAPTHPWVQDPVGDSVALPMNFDREALRGPGTRLAASLYGRVAAAEKGNVLVAPHSVATSLAMLSAGARGETAQECAAVLGHDLPLDRLHAAMAAMADALPLGDFQGQHLHLANRLWVQRGDVPLAEDFLLTTRHRYGAEAFAGDLKDDATRLAINDWTAQHTAGRIRDLFPTGALAPQGRLVLANAVAFQGHWTFPFSKYATTVKPFHTPHGPVETPTMHADDFKAEYVRLKDVEVLTKEYRGYLALTVLLPRVDLDFATFEQTLTGENLTTWLTASTLRHVEIFLPKFKFETTQDLKPALTAMGLKHVFDRGHADLTGISLEGGMYLTDWKQRTQVEVDEQGTVVPSATIPGVLAMGSSERTRTPVFRADRPFVFVIHDRRTGAILFLGRVVKPG